MTLEELTLAMFAVCNSLRVVGFIPQMVCTLRDQTGGESTSVASWLIFLTSHVSVAAYAFVNLHDTVLAAMFLVNAFCCLLIACATLWKRNTRARMRREREGHGLPCRQPAYPA